MIDTNTINKVVYAFFDNNPDVQTVPAKDLARQMVSAGIYVKNSKDGLPLRNDLRELQRAKQLHLIPTLVAIKKEKNTNWFFQRPEKSEVGRHPKAWTTYCTAKLNLLCGKPPQPFAQISSKLPVTGGIYLITLVAVNGKEKPLYIGRTTKLKQRIHSQHYLGGISSARLKKYIMEEFDWDKARAKDYILQNCLVRWITNEEMQNGNPFPQEDEHRIRGALEGYFTGVLFPKYGIYKEH